MGMKYKNNTIIFWMKEVCGVSNLNLLNIVRLEKNLNIILKLMPKELMQRFGLRQKVAQVLVEKRVLLGYHDYYEVALLEAQKHGVGIITYVDQGYPMQLKSVYDAPVIIFVKGRLLKQDNKSIAIVGTRHPTAYGKKAAYNIGKGLADQGFTIISGMASGIDSASHLGALDSGGRTLAILGTGLDQCYPKSNKKLYSKIIESGGALSEYPIGTDARPYHFPQRNRIISGLSCGVVVVEAGMKSGTMITVNHGLDQGKQIFAVPGNIYNSMSKGTNQLLRNGAAIVTEVSDILNELGYSYIEETVQRDYKDLSQLESEILQVIIKNEPIVIEELLMYTKSSVVNIGAYITALELKGYIDRVAGNMLVVK